MSFNRLPSNSEQLLAELVQAENPTQALCDRFGQASQREDDELRSILKELRLHRYIDIKWADNLPYLVKLNNSARTYNEKLTQYDSHNTMQTMQAEKVNSIIFISHRSTDKAVADMLVDFFSGTVIPRKAIFCSSLPGNDINERISGEVKDALRNSAVNIAILSQNYYQSAYCLNEAGILWYQDVVPTIPIALPEINANNMYGFLNSEYKLRRLDSDTDISYIYDVVSEAISAPHIKVSVITRENQKLRDRYAYFLSTREEPTQISTTPTIAVSNITTDDEKIVLYYILQKKVRKVSKETITDWFYKSEIYDVNVDNAFDLLSSFDGGAITDGALEFGINTFREYSEKAGAILPELEECVNSHRKLAIDTFKALWCNDTLDTVIGLFVAYIVDERICLFGNRWMAEEQIESIKEWESKNTLDFMLSSNYGRCLEVFIQNNLVYESNWTSFGNPKEYTLCPSLQKFLFNCPIEFAEALEKIKNTHYLELPF